MMCSEYELGISNEHDGIIHLNENEKVGTSFAKISGLNDIVIEIGITPNRQDCLGVNGIARDLAAAGMGELIDKKGDLCNAKFQNLKGWINKNDAWGC